MVIHLITNLFPKGQLWGQLSPSIAWKQSNQSLVTTPWLLTSWLGPGTADGDHHRSSKISSPEVGSKLTLRNLRVLLFGHSYCQTIPIWEGKITVVTKSNLFIKLLFTIDVDDSGNILFPMLLRGWIRFSLIFHPFNILYVYYLICFTS